MKKTMIALILIASMPALAETETCKKISDFAEWTMEQRQANVPMADVVGKIENKSVRAIAIDSYRKPIFSTPKNQQGAVTEFGSKYYMICISQME